MSGDGPQKMLERHAFILFAATPVVTTASPLSVRLFDRQDTTTAEGAVDDFSPMCFNRSSVSS